ncbi:hypothetical protein VTK56DRAFT_1414 [Thermocarpiscus australiensis]
MTSILCLAHYCDLHGPTPLMVTEGLPVPCNACCDQEPQGSAVTGPDRPQSSAPATGESSNTTTTTNYITAALQRLDFAGQPRSSSVPASAAEAQAHRASLRNAAQATAVSGSAIETPPQSPRLPQGSRGLQQNPRQDSGFRRTYDEYVTRRAGPCENCALTLPKRQEGIGDVGVETSPARGPTLRTRAPCARVFSGIDSNTSPPASQSSSSVTSEDESTSRPRQSHRRTATAVSVTPRSSASSGSTSPGGTGVSANASANAHTHYLDYTSTHEPLAPSSFSIVRASCLRTLSLETLPRTPATCPPSAGSAMLTPSNNIINNNNNNNSNPPSSPAFVTTHSIGAAASGGPIFFGDPATGYTTAYIFRIPDVHARGHKRVYAFLALSTHRERLAMKTFGFVAAAFRDMAAWIQELAEAEAERAAAAAAAGGGMANESSSSAAASPVAGGSASSSPVAPGPGYGSFRSELATAVVAATAPGPTLSAGSGSNSSSFLMGGVGGLSRRMGGGFGGAGVALKQRGLAELVGLPDFFLELHAKFVRLLLELGVMLGS